LWEDSKDKDGGVSCVLSVVGLEREVCLLANPKEWRVLMEFSNCLVLVGAGGVCPLAVASFHIPGGVDDKPSKDGDDAGDEASVVATPDVVGAAGGGTVVPDEPEGSIEKGPPEGADAVAADGPRETTDENGLVVVLCFLWCVADGLVVVSAVCAEAIGSDSGWNSFPRDRFVTGRDGPENGTLAAASVKGLIVVVRTVKDEEVPAVAAGEGTAGADASTPVGGGIEGADGVVDALVEDGGIVGGRIVVVTPGTGRP
jgi:hypothetical protein